jgi:uncharacterized membrane protein YoaK (UPF0700 family)
LVTRSEVVATTTSDRAQWPRWVFRATNTLALLVLFYQAVSAGQFLSGDYESLLVHQETASVSGFSVLLVLVAAVLLRWPGRGPTWPIAAGVGLLGLIGLQIAVGEARMISLHVPLGILVIMAAAALTAWSWRSAE